MYVSLLPSRPIISQPNPGSILTFNDNEDQVKIYEFEFQSFGMSRPLKEDQFVVKVQGGGEQFSEFQDESDSEVESLVSMIGPKKNLAQLSLNNVITESVPLDLLAHKRESPGPKKMLSVSNNSQKYPRSPITGKQRTELSMFYDDLNDSMDDAILRQNCSGTKESFKRIKRYQEVLKSPKKEEKKDSGCMASLVQLFQKTIS